MSKTHVLWTTSFIYYFIRLNVTPSIPDPPPPNQCCLHWKEELRVLNSTLILGEGGGCTQGEGDKYDHYPKMGPCFRSLSTLLSLFVGKDLTYPPLPLPPLAPPPPANHPHGNLSQSVIYCFVVFKVFYKQTLVSSGMLGRFSVCFAMKLKECSMIAWSIRKTNAISTLFCQKWHRNTSHRWEICNNYLLTIYSYSL